MRLSARDERTRRASSQCLHLREPHPDLPASTLCPPFDVYTEREEPQAASSFSQRRRQLDPGRQVHGQARRKEVAEAVDQVGEAVYGRSRAATLVASMGARHRPSLHFRPQEEIDPS